MAKVSQVEKDLSAVTGVKRGPKDSDKSLAKRLHTAASELDEKAWNNMSGPAQLWFNAYSAYLEDDRDTAPAFDEDLMPKKAKGKKAKDEDDEDEDEDDDEDEKPSKSKKSKKSKDDDEDADEDDEDGDERPSKKSSNKKSKSDDDEDEDEDEDDMAAKKKAKKAGKDKKPEKKKGGMRGGGDPGYKGKDGTVHRAGSTKGDVHKAYDDDGWDAALKLAKKRDIKEGSAKSWMATWGGKDGGGGKKAKKKSKD